MGFGDAADNRSIMEPKPEEQTWSRTLSPCQNLACLVSGRVGMARKASMLYTALFSSLVARHEAGALLRQQAHREHTMVIETVVTRRRGDSNEDNVKSCIFRP